jgi:tight adherence protein C
MISRTAVPVLIVGWVGLALVLGEIRWLRRSGLRSRLAPFTPATPGAAPAQRSVPGRTLRQVLGPIASDAADRLSRFAGVTVPLADRLERAGSGCDVEAFRLRQLVHSLVGAGATGCASMALGFGAVLASALALGGAVLAALLDEHRLDRALEDRNERRRRELPAVTEQLGILLAAGWSVTGAVARVADRGSGVVAEDLRSVVMRVRSGSTEAEALAAWASTADLPAVSRLVGVLGMHRETTDLGALIAAEARAVREECHRELLETIERRAQLVWIPVTVATLVPGLLLLAVPFVGAVSAVTGG